MKQNKKIASKSNHIAKTLKSAFKPVDEPVAKVIKQTNEDLRNSILVVSLGINVFILTSWLVLEATNVYNSQIISYLQR